MTFRKESQIVVPEITKEEEGVLEEATVQSDVVDGKVTDSKVILSLKSDFLQSPNTFHYS